MQPVLEKDVQKSYQDWCLEGEKQEHGVGKEHSCSAST